MTKGHTCVARPVIIVVIFVVPCVHAFRAGWVVRQGDEVDGKDMGVGKG